MPGLFRQGPPPHQTALAMIGAKPGDRLVVAGAHDPDLAAELALVTGLNGQTTVYDDRKGAREEIEAAAARAGALVEFVESGVSRAPLGAGSQDVFVLARPIASLSPDDRVAALSEAMRVLRPGGRVIVLDGGRRMGLLGKFQPRPPQVATAEVLDLLTIAGAKAQRQLAEVDGIAYYEARKASS
jgi:ubiquinone/menaquinone biosynthesis C-methylase UbiE